MRSRKSKVGHNRMYTTYMTVYLVIFLPKLLYIHCIYIWFWPTLRKSYPEQTTVLGTTLVLRRECSRHSVT